MGSDRGFTSRPVSMDQRCFITRAGALSRKPKTALSFFLFKWGCYKVLSWTGALPFVPRSPMVTLQRDLCSSAQANGHASHLALHERLLCPFLTPAKSWQQLELGRSLPAEWNPAPESSLRCTILHSFHTLKTETCPQSVPFCPQSFPFLLLDPSRPLLNQFSKILHATCCSWALCDLKMETLAKRTPWYH